MFVSVLVSWSRRDDAPSLCQIVVWMCVCVRACARVRVRVHVLVCACLCVCVSFCLASVAFVLPHIYPSVQTTI